LGSLKESENEEEEGEGIHAMRSIRQSILGFIVLASLTAVLGGCAPTSPSPSKVELVGRLHVLWGDGPPNSQKSTREYWLKDEANRWYRLLLKEELLQPWGGPQALDGRWIRIRGEMVDPQAPLVRVLFLQPQPEPFPT